MLIGDGIFRIMDILHDDGTGFVLITNGYLLDEKIVKKLKKYRFFWVQVSIDGSDSSFHDAFRCKVGSWEKAVRAAVMVSSAGLPLTIASSVTPQNIDKIEDMADLAYSLGASTIILGEIMVSGRSYKNRDILLSQEESAKMKQIIKKLETRYLDKMTVQTSATDVYQLNYSKTHPNSTAIIRPNGDVRLDCVAPFIGGNVLKQDFVEIWNNKLKNVWENSAVSKYAEDMTRMSDFDMDIINHVDDDIEL
ncbi:hypothetical protein AGMMS50276_00480 [Synergistales bacterium]|nr:hypothetical protein AGMMS50276_00480 [Synergistales bacterium]